MDEENETLTWERAAKTDNGKGNKVDTWNPLGTITGRVRYFRAKNTREQLENEPGNQHRTERLIVCDEPFPAVKRGDRLTRVNGEKFMVIDVRPYSDSLQLDTEIVT